MFLSLGCWLSLSHTDCLTPCVLSALGICLQQIQKCLKENHDVVTLLDDEITLSGSVMVFSYTNSIYKMPSEIKENFRSINYTIPDIGVVLNINLIKSSMFLSSGLVNRVKNFLEMIQITFVQYSDGFAVRLISDLCNAMFSSYKAILKCKDGEYIAKGLSSVTEVISSTNNSVVNNIEEREELITKRKCKDIWFPCSCSLRHVE